MIRITRASIPQALVLGTALVCAALVVRSNLHPSRRAPATQASISNVEQLLQPIHGPTPPTQGDAQLRKCLETARRQRDDPQAWITLGDALMQKWRETTDALFSTRAEGAYRQALQLNPKSSEAMAGLAWVHDSRHEFAESTSWAKQAVALDPRNSHAFGLLGDAATELGDYDAALQHYQTMIDLRPDLSSYGRGGYLLFLHGDTRKAMWLMQKAIEAGGAYAEQTAWAQAHLARMYWAVGALLPAEQLLEQGLQGAPDHPRLLAMMGRVKASLGRYSEARDYLTRASSRQPELIPDEVVWLAELHAHNRDPKQANAVLTKLQHSHTGSANTEHGAAQLALYYADHGEKLDTALRIAEQEYRDARNIYNADLLAWCYLKNNQLTAAEAKIREALRLKTPEPRFYYHAGMIYYRLGKRRQAQKYLQQALTLNSRFSISQAQIAADTLARLGGGARTATSR